MIGITQYINKLWRESLNASHSIVDSYLHSRGLLLDSMPRSIRYQPNLYHKPTNKSFPAMLSAVTKYGNAGIMGLHRTYLKADGVDKADISPNKMMLGHVKGGAVKFGSPNGTLILAEGIETALSVYLSTGIPTWACLSTSGLMTIEVPPLSVIQEIIIAVDNDNAGIIAANTLANRLLAHSYEVKLAIPPAGTDFNDLLKVRA